MRGRRLQRVSLRCPAAFAAVAGALFGAAAGAAPPAPERTWRAVREGIVIELGVEPVAGGGELREGDDAAFRLRLSDAAAGQPLAGLSPAAWVSRLAPGETLDGPACVRKVEEFVGGSILTRPQLDLNVYYVLALNHDASISVVDPLFGFGGSKLLAMIRLLSPGEDWALTADQKRLFVSQPESDRVAAADTATWEVEKQIDAGRRPSRVVLQPDGAYLWVGLEPAGGAGSGVAVVDARNLRVVARIPTGKGRHDIAVSDDSRFAFITNEDDGTLSVIDVARLAKVADVHVGSRPASVAWSSLAAAAYVAAEGDGAVVAVDGGGRVLARAAAAPGLVQIRFAPDGRLGFLSNPKTDTLYVLDVPSNRLIQTGEMQREPDQVAFSDELVYVRHRGSDTVLMIPLDVVGKEGGTVPIVDFPGGEHPFGQGRRPSRASSIVQVPGEPAVLVANPADQMIYYYKEGMAAPMGGFKNYDREPRAVLVVDRSLHERGRPGTYETVARLPPPGRYRVALFVDSPRTIHCFEAEVTANPALEAQRRANEPVRVAPLSAGGEVAAGEAVPLRFRLTDPWSGKPRSGVRDLVVLAYPAAATWQNRLAAREVGEGVYEASFVPPAAGTYFVVVESASQRLPFHRSPRLTLHAVARTPPAP